ncbi:hypothetical protein EJB05_55680, partial [Eragrostis curvula]
MGGIQEVAVGSDADAVITKVDGEWNIQLQGQITDGRASSGTTAQEMNSTAEDKKVNEARTWLTLLATVAASVTYQAGLNPPGGFWQADDSQGHHAGNPVLRDEYWLRYQTFYYFNATAFVTSLAMIVVLVSDRFFRGESKVCTLGVTACINVASLIGAYAAGSTLSNSSTMFVVILACVALVGIIYLGVYGDGRYLHLRHDKVSLRAKAGEVTLVANPEGGGAKRRGCEAAPCGPCREEEEHWNLLLVLWAAGRCGLNIAEPEAVLEV